RQPGPPHDEVSPDGDLQTITMGAYSVVVVSFRQLDTESMGFAAVIAQTLDNNLPGAETGSSEESYNQPDNRNIRPGLPRSQKIGSLAQNALLPRGNSNPHSFRLVRPRCERRHRESNLVRLVIRTAECGKRGEFRRVRGVAVKLGESLKWLLA